MRLVTVAALAAVLATPAVALQDRYFYGGTLTGKVSAKVGRNPKSKADVARPNTTLDFQRVDGLWGLQAVAYVLTGTQGPGVTKGRFTTFKVARPTEQADVAALEGEVQQFLVDSFGLVTSITKVRIKGTHRMPADFFSVRTKLGIKAKGVTTSVADGLPVKAKISLTLEGVVFAKR